jgi:hypothetical protein
MLDRIRKRSSSLRLHTRRKHYCLIPKSEKAIESLEKVYGQRAGYLPSVATDFVYENLHGEPRYEVLLQKMGLRCTKKFR